MIQCFQNPNLLDIICMYLNIKEILYLSMCNWNLKKILDPNDKNDDKNDSKDNKNSENFANSNTNQNTDQNSDSNSSQYVNVLFYFTIQNEFFDFDKSIFKSKKNLLGKIHNFRVKWKKYLIKLLINFSIIVQNIFFTFYCKIIILRISDNICKTIFNKTRIITIGIILFYIFF